MGRLLGRGVMGLLLVLAVVYVADWLVWNVRDARGNGTEQISVNQVSAAQLKNHREEYSFDGAITMTCAKSVFPPLTAGGWMPTCWYMRQHPTQVDRI